MPGAIEPEGIYFTDAGAGRDSALIVDPDDAGQAPLVTESLMRDFGASVQYRLAMPPEDLQSAGPGRYARLDGVAVAALSRQRAGRQRRTP